MANAMGAADHANRLRGEAAALRARFEAAFWSEQIGTYAMALDGAKRPCLVRSSNAGQVLLSGICLPERAEAVARQLLGNAFFNGWGIRTIASGEPRYNPMSYHNGSVWPHDNALIGIGMARYGLKEPLLRMVGGLYDAAAYMELRRLPELFCGFRRGLGEGPTFYPVACSPQAWAGAVPFALLQALLGLEIDHATLRVRFHQPRLPDFLDEVTIRSLAVGRGRMDIQARRHGDTISVTVLSREGQAQVEVMV
jgi:glycogen debranching enzyme